MLLRVLRWHSHSKENKDSIQDVLLLLYLIRRADNRLVGKDRLQTQIKLMKLVFLTEQRFVDQRLKGFNFFFNIFKHGPSSLELLKMIDFLINSELVSYSKDNKYSLTEKGTHTIDDFITTSRNENRELFEVVDSVVSEYADLSTDEIINRVYEMEIKPMHSNSKLNIGDAVKKNMRTRLLMKMDPTESKRELTVSDSWVETMNLILNPEFSH